MVRFALIAIAFVLAGCQSAQQTRFNAASAAKARAEVKLPRMETPSSCIAKVGRVYPKDGDKWVHIQKRWEITADNRDRQSEDCAAVLRRFWNALEAADADTENKS